MVRRKGRRRGTLPPPSHSLPVDGEAAAARAVVGRLREQFATDRQACKMISTDVVFVVVFGAIGTVSAWAAYFSNFVLASSSSSSSSSLAAAATEEESTRPGIVVGPVAIETAAAADLSGLLWRLATHGLVIYWCLSFLSVAAWSAGNIATFLRQRAGAWVNAEQRRADAFIVAVAGRGPVVKLVELISRAARPPDIMGVDPGEGASNGSRSAAACRLVNTRDSFGRTPLWAAVASRLPPESYDAVRFLLSCGAVVDAPVNGVSPLYVACRLKDEEMVRVLLGAGACPHGAAWDATRQPLHAALGGSRFSHGGWSSLRRPRLQILSHLFTAGACAGPTALKELTCAQDPEEWRGEKVEGETDGLLAILRVLVEEGHAMCPGEALQDLRFWWYASEAEERRAARVTRTAAAAPAEDPLDAAGSSATSARARAAAAAATAGANDSNHIENEDDSKECDEAVLAAVDLLAAAAAGRPPCPRAVEVRRAVFTSAARFQKHVDMSTAAARSLVRGEAEELAAEARAAVHDVDEALATAPDLRQVLRPDPALFD